MANTKSAIKRIRSSRRKQERNRVFRSRARTFVKKARRLIEEGQFDEAEEVVRQAISALDKAAEKGIIHKNNAARRKSRLMRRFNQARGL
ncbi:MAG: 30S ribosomal protein S20 [Chloroflexi bacterium]|nr:30S ribosomal protein S20 [Anaerolineae bacterium]RLC70407.1 MAG: 30S ribosomal protein S20 [Chloroflexota bacterium]